MAETDEELKQLVRESPLGIGAREYLRDLKAEVKALRGVRVKEEDTLVRLQLFEKKVVYVGVIYTNEYWRH